MLGEQLTREQSLREVCAHLIKNYVSVSKLAGIILI